MHLLCVKCVKIINFKNIKFMDIKNKIMNDLNYLKYHDKE